MRRYKRKRSKSNIRLPTFRKRYRRRYPRKVELNLSSIFLLLILIIGGFILFHAVTDQKKTASYTHDRVSYSSSSAISYPSYTVAPKKATSSPAPSHSSAPTSTPVYVSPEAVNRIAASIAEAISGPQGTPQSAVTPFMTAAPTKAPSPTTAKQKTQAAAKVSVPRATAASTPIPGTTYVLNRNTKKFHKPSCSSVKQIKDSNRVDYFGTYSEVINMGYQPCKRCNPK